jgi:hypothetical protein
MMRWAASPGLLDAGSKPMAANSSPQADIKALLAAPEPDGGAVAEVFDSLAIGDSVLAARTLSGTRNQRQLWKAAASQARIDVDDLIPRDYDPMKPVVFHGKNSLPAFSEFRKICCRAPGDIAPGKLWGYNDTTIEPLIGPGYYVVHDTSGSEFGGAAFDYTELPSDRVDGWPAIRPNTYRLSRFVYNGTVDYMRRVARDVFIGMATRKERSLGSYFILVRELD